MKKKNTNKMNIVFIGSINFSYEILKEIIKNKFKIISAVNIKKN